jgi:hypothetical protein
MLPTDINTASRDLYNATSDTFFSDTQIYNWMYIAEQELAWKARCIEKINSAGAITTTTSGTQSYAYPTNTFSIKRITVNGKKLKRITGREDDAITLSNSTVTTQGWPIYYTDFGTSIAMRPIPDSSSYPISWYTYDLPTLPSATGTLDVPVAFHMWLCDYVLYRMFAKDKDTVNMQFHKGEWDKHVVNAVQYMRLLHRNDSFKTVQSEDNLPVTILGEA